MTRIRAQVVAGDEDAARSLAWLQPVTARSPTCGCSPGWSMTTAPWSSVRWPVSASHSAAAGAWPCIQAIQQAGICEPIGKSGSAWSCGTPAARTMSRHGTERSVRTAPVAVLVAVHGRLAACIDVQRCRLPARTYGRGRRRTADSALLIRGFGVQVPGGAPARSDLVLQFAFHVTARVVRWMGQS
jgi:hypothetical protein